MSDLTHLLAAAQAGDRQAAADLLPLVYDELRKLAAARMAAESPGHTLDATALVHEAYLRLVGDQRFDGRGHFFAAAAEAMRRVLVNHARDRGRARRGGGRVRLELLDRAGAVAEDPNLVASLDDLLTRLAGADPAAARVGALRGAHDAAPPPPPGAADSTRTLDAAPTADFRPGPGPGVVVAGRYKLLEPVGEGGMGEVWVAQQTEPVRRKVALKLIKP